MQEALAKMKEVGHCGKCSQRVMTGVSLMSESDCLSFAGGRASQEGGGGAAEEAGGAGEAEAGAGKTPPPLASFVRSHPSVCAATFDLPLRPSL